MALEWCVEGVAYHTQILLPHLQDRN